MDTEVPRYTAVSEMCLPRVICFNLYQELFSAKQNQKRLLNQNKKDLTPGPFKFCHIDDVCSIGGF